MKEVVIVSAARTAIGNFNGSLSTLSAVDLGIAAAREGIQRLFLNIPNQYRSNNEPSP
ncbi:MAG: hypothetical protein PWR20_2341 [Bacteroidales bacterium]|jgi:acetyl-CoA C-acetyltransferase|nr:hypothetical protein [Bacteroidales bacterium]MDN5330685.1 hypothetical protein [Bacteroidales bacterium]